MPILVIGATGTNARHVVRGLLEAGQSVRALVRDAARARAAVAVEALTGAGHEGQAYVLTGPQALGYVDVAAQLAEATGAPVRYVPITPAAYRDRLLAAGYPAWNAQAFADIDVAAGDQEFAQVTDTVARLTGRPPRSFAQFARDHADRFSRHTR